MPSSDVTFWNRQADSSNCPLLLSYMKNVQQIIEAGLPNSFHIEIPFQYGVWGFSLIAYDYGVRIPTTFIIPRALGTCVELPDYACWAVPFLVVGGTRSSFLKSRDHARTLCSDTIGSNGTAAASSLSSPIKPRCRS